MFPKDAGNVLLLNTHQLHIDTEIMDQEKYVACLYSHNIAHVQIITIASFYVLSLTNE